MVLGKEFWEKEPKWQCSINKSIVLICTSQVFNFWSYSRSKQIKPLSSVYAEKISSQSHDLGAWVVNRSIFVMYFKHPTWFSYKNNFLKIIYFCILELLYFKEFFCLSLKFTSLVGTFLPTGKLWHAYLLQFTAFCVSAVTKVSLHKCRSM